MLSGYKNTPASPLSLLSILWVPRAQFWFLYGLFFVSVVCATLYISAGMRRGLASLPLALFLAVYLLPYSGSWRSMEYVFSYSIFFCLGGYYDQFAVTMLKNVKLTACVLAAVAIGIVCCVAYGVHFALISLAIAGLTILAIVYVSMRLGAGSFLWLSLLGRESMNIYLMHILVGAGVRIFMLKVLHINDLYVHLIVGVLVGLTAPLTIRAILRKVGADFMFSPPGWLSADRWVVRANLGYSETRP